MQGYFKNSKKGELEKHLDEVAEIVGSRKAALKRWSDKFDYSFSNHLSGDVGVEEFTAFFKEWIYITKKGQGGHFINKFLEIIRIVNPPNTKIGQLANDIPFEAKVMIKSSDGVKFSKDAVSSMFPKNWSFERIKEEVAWVYENTVVKNKGFKSEIKGIYSYEGVSTNGFNIRVQIKDGVIVNSHPINI